MKIIVFDTEATDLTPGQICQLSYLIVEDGQVTGKNMFFAVDERSEGAYEVHGRSMEDLENYTLAGTNKILIELPFGRITDRIITELEEVAFKKNLVPILAHLERYVCYEGIEKIYEAIWNGTMRAQVTADTVETFMGRRSISKLIKKEIFSYIGSDAHSILERPSKIKKFLSFIKSKHKEFYRVYNESSDRLYDDIKNK